MRIDDVRRLGELRGSSGMDERKRGRNGGKHKYF